MRNLIFVLLGLAFCEKALCTAQLPDLLIYNNDTLNLYSNPLESFYNDTNPRPQSFGFARCMSTACWRGYQAIWEIKNDSLFLNSITDCCGNKEYELTKESLAELENEVPIFILEKIKPMIGKHFNHSEIEDELRNLIGERKRFKYSYEIISKCKTYDIKQKADLKRLFGESLKNNLVFAGWFNGKLTLPKGKLIEYVHMGYLSKYEKELDLIIKNGKLIEKTEHENKPGSINNM